MNKLIAFSAMMVLAGCFTVKETEFPQTAVTNHCGRNRKDRERKETFANGGRAVSNTG